MKCFFDVNDTIFFIQTKFRQESWGHHFADLRNGEKHINFRNGLNVLVPNELMLTKFLNDLIQKGFVTARNSLLMSHKLLTQLICFGCGISLKTSCLTGENQCFWPFFRFQTIFGYLDFVSGPNTYECNFIVIVVGSIFFKFFM